jgi:hypothetical protein
MGLVRRAFGEEAGAAASRRGARQWEESGVAAEAAEELAPQHRRSGPQGAGLSAEAGEAAAHRQDRRRLSLPGTPLPFLLFPFGPEGIKIFLVPKNRASTFFRRP